MRRFTTIWLLGTLALGAQEADKAADQAAATGLRETIQQWIQTEEIASRELADWQADQARMQELLALHRAELQQLDELLAKAGESSRNADEEKQALQAETAALSVARASFIKDLAGFQIRAAAIAKRLPEPLRETTKDQIEMLTDLSATENPRELTQALIGMINSADEFNATIPTFSEIREVAGKRMKVRTLYLGLGQAFYASEDGKSAGIGKPGPDGWQWSERPELANGILRALAVASKDERPDFVELPLQVQP